MRTRPVSTSLRVAALIAASVTVMAAAAEPPPAAPLAGSPGTYVGHAAVEAVLATATAASKDPAAAPIVTTDQYIVTAVRRMKPIAPPAIHPGWTEVHYVLEGGGVFVTGGKIVTPAGAKMPVIEGGVSQRIEKGDTVVVPPGTPHWYQQIDGNFKAVEVRFIAPVK